MRIRSLRVKLILAMLAIALPLLALAIANQLSEIRESRPEPVIALRGAATDVSEVLVTYYQGLTAIGLAVGDRFFTGGIFSRDLASTVSSINRSGRAVRRFCLISTGGTVTVSNTPGMIGLDLSRDRAVRAVLDGADWSTTDAGIFPGDRSEAGVVTGVRDSSGGLRGMILVLADESDLRAALPQRSGTAERVVVTDTRGVVVMSTGPGLTWAQRQWGDRPYILEALSGRVARVNRMTMPDDQVMTGIVVPIAEIGRTVGVFTPIDGSLAAFERESARRILMVIALALLVLGLVLYLSSTLSRPIRRLARSVREFGDGRLEVRSQAGTGDEVGYLADKFNDMARALQYRQQATPQGPNVEALYRTGEEVLVTAGLSEELQIVARSLSEMTGAKRCVILLRRGESIVGAAGWGLSRPEVVESFNASLEELEPPLAKAAETRKPVMVPEEGGTRVLPDSLRGFHVARLLALPIIHGDGFAGLAVLDSAGELTTFTGQSVDAALQVSELAAVAIENARLHERETRISRDLRHGLLPSVPQGIGKLRLAAGYYPASESAEVGGDFYDYIELPDGRIGLALGDVSGRGLESAVYSWTGKCTVRALLVEDPSPSSALSGTNEALLRSSREWAFMTAFVGVVNPETRVLTWAGAGSPPAVLVRATGETSCIPCSEQQPPLGILDGIAYVERSLSLNAGDTLVCYTDGLVKAHADGEVLDVERLSQLVARNRHMEPEGLVDVIYAKARESVGGYLPDDTAILILKAT